MVTGVFDTKFFNTVAFAIGLDRSIEEVLTCFTIEFAPLDMVVAIFIDFGIGDIGGLVEVSLCTRVFGEIFMVSDRLFIDIVGSAGLFSLIVIVELATDFG